MNYHTVPCHFCSAPVVVGNRYTWRRVKGWERKGQQGGSDIVLRERQAQYACEACITLRRSDRTAGQESLI